MTALPDSKSKTEDSVDGPELIYNITNLNQGELSSLDKNG